MLGGSKLISRSNFPARLEGHRNGVGVERVGRLGAVAQLDVLVAAHAFLTGQPEPALADQLDAVAGTPDLASR